MIKDKIKLLIIFIILILLGVILVNYRSLQKVGTVKLESGTTETTLEGPTEK